MAAEQIKAEGKQHTNTCEYDDVTYIATTDIKTKKDF